MAQGWGWGPAQWGTAGSSVEPKQGSGVVTDERLIHLLKVQWIVSKRTGFVQSPLSFSTPPLLLLLFEICPQGTKGLSLVICVLVLI